MAQAFLTVYEKTYIWHDYTKRTRSEKPAETIYAEAPKADIWLPPIVKGYKTFDDSTSIDDLKKFVNKLYRRRNWTTYQISYCKKQILKEEGDEQEEEKEENELIEYGKRVYSEPTQKIMQPLPTARKLYGYLRPRNMYTGLSEYQGTVGKNGFDILLRNYNACKKKA